MKLLVIANITFYFVTKITLVSINIIVTEYIKFLYIIYYNLYIKRTLGGGMCSACCHMALCGISYYCITITVLVLCVYKLYSIFN